MNLLSPERAKRDATDKIDARILRVLQRDGRISNLKLAEEVCLSPTAVTERVKRLQRDGYILGYRARLNPEKLGKGLVAFVEVLLDRTAADVMSTFTAAVQARAEILECHLVAGVFDYLLKLRVSDVHAWREQVAAVVGSLPSVRDSRSYTVMEQVKHGNAIVL
jgi:Lrp/AsnC family leucine-responsive transcriptional regulator